MQNPNGKPAVEETITQQDKDIPPKSFKPHNFVSEPVSMYSNMGNQNVL